MSTAPTTDWRADVAGRGHGDHEPIHPGVEHGMGEDGPTHQPVEHPARPRAIPGLTVLRPADGRETAAAWRAALEDDGPSALLLSLPGWERLRALPEPAQHRLVPPGVPTISVEAGEP